MLSKRPTFAAILLIAATSAFARVTRVEVAERTDLSGGAYERITGKIHFAIDPASPHNRVIVDLDRAPRNERGEVEFTSDLYIVRPKHGSDAMFVEISNRGGRSAVLAPERDDFLLRHGFTVASVGWQFDVRRDPDLIRLDAPVAGGITGKVRVDFVVAEKKSEHPLGHVIAGQVGGTGYAVADINDASAVLTERESQTAERRPIPRSRWRFTDANTIHLDTGFVPGRIYEAIYTAKDPAVVGTGLAAVRDFVSYAKHDANAVVSAQHVYAFGISQSGRFLRHMLYQGFNADEDGRQAFDGMVIIVAGAGRGSFNHRFAQPSRDAQAVSPLFYPTDLFPFTDLPTTDPVSGRTEGLLDRAIAENVAPKVMYINTSYEFWSRGESLTFTTPDGSREVELPKNVRLYTIAGMSHIGGPFPPAKSDNVELLGTNLRNPSSYWPVAHAMFVAIDAWSRGNVDPPPSRYPHLADGTLVRTIPGAPVRPYEPYTLDLGSDWPRSVAEPPRVLGTYPAYVPKVDADGNEIGGIRLPNVAVPLATWTGWNPRDPKIGFPNERTSFVGSYIPYSKARIDRLYRDKYDYLGRYAEAAMQLVKERYVVADDLPSILNRGTEEWDYARKRAENLTALFSGEPR
ncbi:MAG TPA: alpha/beta hydrolase domain-containing protein [Thermoanaerobaculia bacterium]